ncbi:MAG: M20 family peptidase [Planctomycetota bacterium]|nr:MAG: M20 family peptidase [Planctomycetota bacterium]REJ89395.1 MAG: M20 family peptidase [Planctomycetota bacterium]
MNSDLVELLAKLVRIPSVNPMGLAAADSDLLYECRLTDFLAEWLRERGILIGRQLVEELPDGRRRENLLARFDAGDESPKERPLLLWEVHQDTVPVEGMTIEPFAAEVWDGRLYGRGACDVKGGMAAMLTALARLAREQPAGCANVVLALTVNEEHGFSGASALSGCWREIDEFRDIFPRRPAACVVAEPTDLDVVVAHKGVVRWNCHTRGRAVHSSRPQDGENAIYKMAPVLSAFARYADEVVASLGEDPLCGRPSLSVGTIHGGTSVNTVPDGCTVAIDRRLLPGESPEAAQRHAMDYVSAQVGPEAVVHDAPTILSPGLESTENAELAARLGELARRHGARGDNVGVPYGTDAAILARGGLPTVVFGPGSIEQAHTKDEWVELAEVERASEIYYELAATYSV